MCSWRYSATTQLIEKVALLEITQLGPGVHSVVVVNQRGLLVGLGGKVVKVRGRLTHEEPNEERVGLQASNHKPKPTHEPGITGNGSRW